MGKKKMVDYYSVARVAYEADRAFCESNFIFTNENWHDAPIWKKNIIATSVKDILYQPLMPPMEIHGRLVERLTREGWVYGDKESIEGKTHPMIQDYGEIGDLHKTRFLLFSYIVLALT